MSAAPAIILVEPQMAENIGMAARAMANFGLAEMRLVAPRGGWPKKGARAAASGAVHVLERAALFQTAREAVADLNFVLATTARERGQMKRVLGPEAALRRGGSAPRRRAEGRHPLRARAHRARERRDRARRRDPDLPGRPGLQVAEPCPGRAPRRLRVAQALRPRRRAVRGCAVAAGGARDRGRRSSTTSRRSSTP